MKGLGLTDIVHQHQVVGRNSGTQTAELELTSLLTALEAKLLMILTRDKVHKQ